MVERTGKRVALYLPTELADHVEKSRGWRSASQYIRELIDADMRPAPLQQTDESRSEPRASSKKGGPSVEYIRQVIEWEKGDEAPAMIEECAGIYTDRDVWFRAFAKEATFREWEAKMQAQKTPR